LVKRHLYDRNLKQVWLADQIGITKESLSRIMRGRHKPNADLALAVSEALGLSDEEKQELLATVPQRRRGSKQAPSELNASVLPSPFLVQRSQTSQQRQKLASQLHQLRQDLAEIKRKAMDLVVEIAIIEESIEEIGGKNDGH
jgi:plasmid maintenance system antidote protein VapI